VDREISSIEKQLVEVAEAMPTDKFNFSPENLNLAGSDYKVSAPLPCKSACRRFELLHMVPVNRR